MLKRIRNLYRDEHALPFLLCMLIFGVSVGLYTGALNNYLHEVLSISRMERGIVEFPRELPGLLLFVIIGFLARFSELKVMYFAAIVSLVGMLGLATVGDARLTGIAALVLFSTGEHMMIPVRQSVAMHMARDGQAGLAMGGVSSLTHIGQMAGQYLIPLVFFALGALLPGLTPYSRFRALFGLGAVMLAGAIVVAARIHETHRHIERKKLYFRRKFTKYYILEIFFGARKQVFMTFAPYVLILNYGAKTGYIAFLYGIWSFSNIFLSPLMGNLLDMVGYKLIIVADAAVLLLLCLLYGFSHHLFSPPTAFVVVSVVFVLDAILFAMGMARAMYAKSIAESREEVTATLSSGISINHLVSIVIAMLGGVLWEWLGIEMLFSIAALFGLGSLLFSLTLPASPPPPKA